MPEHDSVQLRAHIGWHDNDNYETVSILKVTTTEFPIVMWIFTKLYLAISIFVNNAWDAVAKCMAVADVL